MRWDATLLSGGWRGSAEDDLLPAAGLLIDAGFDGAVALEGAALRRRPPAPRARAGRRDLGASWRISSPAWRGATPETPTGWCERAAVFAPDAVTEELVELGLVEYREAGWLRKAVRYKAFEILDVAAREAAAARVRDAVARPAHAAGERRRPRASAALDRHAAPRRGRHRLRRNERALEARRATLPPVVAAVLEALDARRRRLDAVGT